MDFLTEREARGLKQDAQMGQAKQSAEKFMFEKKLAEGMGAEIDDALEHPEKMVKNVAFAKKYTKKKRWAVWKENFRRMFGMKTNDGL